MIGDFARTNVIRGYEVDASRTTPLPVVFSFLEQLRWEWMTDPAWGLQDGLHDGYFFVVRRQVLELVERPRFGDALHITGTIETVGRSQIVVRHRLSVDGRPVGHARVTGVWLGPNRRLARLPDTARELGRLQAAQDGPFGELPHPGPAEADASPSFIAAPRQLFAPRGLDLEPDYTFEAEGSRELVVRPSDCDVFEHVNASSCLQFCDEVRKLEGLGGLTNRAGIDYRNEALAGDRLAVDWRRSGDGLVFRIRRGDEALCAAVVAPA
ncbi:MAG: acyl-[acyl-carrier-protein] thioesterase [Myxococcales bacterium]|nr:acyl-[acyl-carrier-protein] thioesterase [Myxococcales bacterium]